MLVQRIKKSSLPMKGSQFLWISRRGEKFFAATMKKKKEGYVNILRFILPHIGNSLLSFKGLMQCVH